MPYSTRFVFHWVVPLTVAGLLAGCQGSRTAFQFVPTSPYASAHRPLPAPVAAEAPALPAIVVRPASPTATSRPLPRTVHRLAVRPLPAPTSLPAIAGTAELVAAPRPHRAHLTPARTQESGLGRIALFFLAIFLGVLAGLGALLSLIPGVSFWGGVGLAAAGLLVLFLLYSLLGGGSKQKANAS